MSNPAIETSEITGSHILVTLNGHCPDRGLLDCPSTLILNELVVICCIVLLYSNRSVTMHVVPMFTEVGANLNIPPAKYSRFKPFEVVLTSMKVRGSEKS